MVSQDVPRRGEIWWAELGARQGSAPAGRRPAVVVSADRFNLSAVHTVVLASVTSNQRLGGAPGNLTLAAGEADLDRPSVVNVTQLAAVDRDVLVRRVGSLPAARLTELDAGLRLVLDL